jgi:hypothetical protein
MANFGPSFMDWNVLGNVEDPGPPGCMDNNDSDDLLAFVV